MEYNEFKPNMKVSLPNDGKEEKGIVLDEYEEYNGVKIYGVIRWENGDEEDFAGMFGTFTQMGGKILEDG